jgi:hypothetical protein
MRTRFHVSAGIVIAAAVGIGLAVTLAGQQSASKPAPAAGAAVAAAPAPTARKSTAKPWTAKTPDGQIDLQGFWTNSTYTRLERPTDVNKEYYTPEEFEERVKRSAATELEQTEPGTNADVHYDFAQFGLRRSLSAYNKNLRTSLIIDPPDGRLPPRVGAAAGAGAGGRGAGAPAAAGAGAGAGGRGAGAPAAAGAGAGAGGRAGAPAGAAGGAGRGGGRGGPNYDRVQNLPNATRCIVGTGGAGPPMMDAGYNANYQIVQGVGTVMILTEMIHDVRIIPLDNRPAPPAGYRGWMGYSRGRWEGNTLVIETTNYNGRLPFNGSSANLKVTERLSRDSEEQITYRFTVEDPTVWTRPWTAESYFEKTNGPIFEHACHEGNYGVANTLAGARLAEKEAAAKGTK